MKRAMQVATVLRRTSVSSTPAPEFTEQPSLSTAAPIVDVSFDVNLGTATGATSYAGSLRYAADDTEIATFTENGTYTPQSADAGEQLYLHVTASNTGGSVTAETLATAAVLYFDQTAFTQSLDAANTNNDFSAWLGANQPTNWNVAAVQANPGQSEVAPDGTAGTGAARFYSSATNSRPLCQQLTSLEVGSVYEVDIDYTAHTQGGFDVNLGTNRITIMSSVRRLQTLGICSGNTTFSLQGRTAPNDGVFNTAKYQKVTLNAVKTAAVAADLRFGFTLPGTTFEGQRVDLWYRLPAGAPYLNGWCAYVVRNSSNTAWDFKLDRVSSGAVTNAINVTDVGTPNAIRVVTLGDDHTCYTGTAGIDGTWTQRGATQTNTTHNTATQACAVYHSSVTPGEFRGAA